MSNGGVTANCNFGANFTYGPGQMKIYRSFPATAKTHVTPSGTGRPMRYGDRIFVRLTYPNHHGPAIAEFVLTDVNDMTEVYGELRRYTRGKHGLAKLYIRNMSRGWSKEQPFMLKHEKGRDFRAPFHV